MISGGRAQFADVVADVVNVSTSGALIRAPQRQPPGSQAPLLLEINGTPLRLNARVVRCEQVAGPLITSTGKYALALTFVDPSPDAVTLLEDLCQTRRGEFESRRLQVSLERRCPKCRSRDVAKEGPRSYSCCQCGQVFTGFRIGFLRFSR
jgi:hypothetical protein